MKEIEKERLFQMIIAYWIGSWIGSNLGSLIFATLMAVVIGLIMFYPLRNNRRFFWNIVITVWFLSFAWKIFQLASGLAFHLTSNPGKSLGLGAIFAVITAATPYIVIKVLKTNTTKWVYSIVVIIIVGCSMPLIQAIIG
ncbi:MAG TPA: hypothetical protein VIL26_07875 [Clostridia bacterium]